jgi:hypothetical protein
VHSASMDVLAQEAAYLAALQRMITELRRG